jgi:hypothetical protein
MAQPIVVFNTTTGSNTLASGAGPAVAVTGTSAAHTNGVTTNIITLTNSPNLSTVPTDGSAVLWMNTASPTRQFSKITGVNNSSKTVTVEDNFAIASGSARNYAIGGKRATWSGSDRLFRLDVKAGWTIETETDQTGSISPCAEGSGGDLVNGPITIRGSEPHKRLIQNASGSCISMNKSGSSNAVKIHIKNLKLVNNTQNSSTSKSAAYGVGCAGTPEFVMENCILGDEIDSLNYCLAAISSTDIPVATFINCDFIFGLNSGTIVQYGGTLRFIGCRFDNNKNTSLAVASGSGGLDGRIEIINCLFIRNGGDAIQLRDLMRGGTVVGCTMAQGSSGTSTAINLIYAGTKIVIYNNNIKTFSRGISIYAGGASGDFRSGYIDFNNYFDVTQPYYDLAFPGANDTVLDPQFKNVNILDHTIGTNLRAKGFPSSSRNIGANQSATKTYVDIGAAQRREKISGIQPVNHIALALPTIAGDANPTLIRGGIGTGTGTGQIDTATKRIAQIFQVPKSGTIDSVEFWSSSQPSVTYKETFDKANSSILGPNLNWTELDGDMEVFSNRCRFVNSSGSRFPGFAVATVTNTMPEHDMSVEVEIYGVTTSSKTAEIIARGDSTALNGYLGARTGTLRAIRKSVNGSVSTLVSTSGLSAPADGTILKLVVYGSTIKLYEGGTLVLTTTDSSITTGQQVGIALEGSGVSVDNFAAAAFTGFGISTDFTTLNTATSPTRYTRSSGSFVADGFQINDIVYASGFTNSINNGSSTVSAVTATSLTVDKALVVESGNGNEKIDTAVDPAARIRVSLQDISGSNGDPDGVQDQFRDVYLNSLYLSSWNRINSLTSTGTASGTKRSVTKGDILAVVWEFQTSGGQINIGYLQGTTSAFGYFPYRDEYDGSLWSKKPSSCEIALLYSDGSYAVPYGSLAQKANTNVIFNSTSFPNERGLVFKLGKSVRLNGFWVTVATLSGNAFNVLLYDKNNNVLKTATIDSDFGGDIFKTHHNHLFSSSQVLNANEIYRLVIKPNSPTNLTFFESEFDSSDIRKESMPGIIDWHSTSRSGGAWTDQTTKKPWIGLLIDGLEGVSGTSPSINVSGTSSVNENSTYTLTLGTPTSAVTNYRINWGDGTSNDYTTNGAKTHTYADGLIKPIITVDLTDASGVHKNTGGNTITVNNISPTITLSGNSSVPRNTTYTLTLGSITDPGSDTVFEWRVDWGDGSSNFYSSGGSKTHTYTTAGTRTISVELADEDGLHSNAGLKTITVT